MNKEVRAFAEEKTRELLEAHTCCAELKEAAQKWLQALGTENEAEETRQYVAELEADIVTVDALIALAESEMGRKIFGDHAPEVAAHAREIKEEGAVYCDCPACAAVEAILARKDELL